MKTNELIQNIDAKINALRIGREYASCPMCVDKDIEELEIIREHIQLLQLDNETLHNQFKKINEVWHTYEPSESIDFNAKRLQETCDFLKFMIKRCDRAENKIIKLLKSNEILKYYASTSFGLNKEIPQQKLNKLEKLEKVNEIMKNEVVSIPLLFETKNVEEFNGIVAPPDQLTRQEYELLKEVLENEK